MSRQTYTVEGGYVGRDGQPRVFVRGRALPVLTDEALPEGTSVVIVGDKAVKAPS